MPIYISFHPIDHIFATELKYYLSNTGFPVRLLPYNPDNNSLAKNDVLIPILRPEYINSSAYHFLSSHMDEITVIPVLRSPISVEDWRGNILLSPIADFTKYGEDIEASNVAKLIGELGQYKHVTGLKVITPLNKYTDHLAISTSHPFFTTDLLEAINYEEGFLSDNPVRTLLKGIQFKVSPKNGNHFADEVRESYRIDQIENIAKYRETCVLVCDYLDVNLVVGFVTNLLERRFVESGGKTSLPYLINLENCNEATDWNEWLCNQIKVGTSLAAELPDAQLTIIIFGFERSPLRIRQVRERLKLYLNQTPPPTPSLFMVSATLDNSTECAPHDVIIRPFKYTTAQMQQLCAKYSHRPFGHFLLSLNKNDESFPQLNYLLENPVFMASLLSVRFEQDTEFSKINIGGCFRNFMVGLWNLEHKEETDFSEATDALSKTAAILTEKQRSFITHKDALKIFPSESLLNKCIDHGLISFIGNSICFPMQLVQDYFAAVALVKYGVPSKLPHLALDKHSQRISQRWDRAIILSANITSEPDKLIKYIADIDPLLALKSIVSGIHISKQLYTHVMEKNLDTFVSLGDFRAEFAKLLYRIDPVTASAILVEVLRNANWPVRLQAFAIWLELNTDFMEGLADSLSDINDDTRTSISQAIKRIGSKSLPTLFQLLRHDNSVIRSNAIWALNELNDKASVPALIKMLWDNNLLVSTQAATVLGTLQDIASVPYLINHLQDHHSSMRKSVINALIQIQSKQPKAFIDIIKQTDAAIRRLVVVYLSNSKIDNLPDFLLTFSYDEDVDVRIAAIEGLATIAEPRVVSRLEECLEDMSKSRMSKSSVSEIVSGVLSKLSNRPDQSLINARNSESVSINSTKPLNSSQIVKARLLNAKEQRLNADYVDSNEHVPIEAEHPILDKDTPLQVTPKLSSEDAYVSNILAQLRGRKWDASSSAAKELRDYVKNLRGKTSLQVVNQILETLNDRDWVIRWTGVEALGWVGNVHVIPHLIQRLSDPNWKVRVAAIRTLAEIKDDTAITGLSSLISDDNAVVREAAAEALGFIDGKQAVNALESAALDPEDFVRLAAVESLGKTHDKQATHTLLIALKDSSDHVRWAAANGLVGIADSGIVSQLIPSLYDTGGPYWEQKRICDVVVDILKQIDTLEARNALTELHNNPV